MYFELYKRGNLIIRSKKTLAPISFDHELNLAPSTTLELDGTWIPLIDGREEVKIYLPDGKVFWGIVWDFDTDKVNETITLDVRHVVSEWQYRQISVNHAMSNKELNIVYKGDEVSKSEDNNETITASDLTVVLKNLGSMSNNDWITKAHAAAWVTSNGNSVDITKVDTSKIKKDEGTYKVAFSTAKETSVTVECEVVSNATYLNPKSKTSKANKETIQARPFEVYAEEGFTADMVKKKVKAKAWVYRHRNQAVAVTSIETDFVNVAGDYNVTASTAKGTSVTVKVTVKSGQQYGTLDDPAVVDKLEDIYNDTNFAYPGWQIEFLDNAENRMIDYVYSRQNKLDALTETVELTDDLWWRVGFWNERKLQIGEFGEEKPYVISTKPSGQTNIRMITEPTIDPDIENVINVATVYSDKSDGGMSSLTLREVYNDPSLQKDGFPVVILHSNVNNERDYSMYVDQYPKLAPNNEIEYAVLDEESIALESGTLIEGTYSFNDLSPFQIEDGVITDEKRIKAAQTVYESVIKRLVQARRSYDITVVTEPLPLGVVSGDKIRLSYDNKLLVNEACSSYWKKLMGMNDWYYITKIVYNFDEYGNETDEVTLAKWLKINRETENTQG